MDNLQKKNIIKEYLSGESQSNLVKKYKTSERTIKRILIENNIVIRKKGDGPRQNKIKFDIDYFKVIDSPDKAYFLGLICADGSIVKQSNKHLHFGRLSITLKDKEILQSFVNKLNSNHKVIERNRFDRRTSKTYRNYSLNINSKYFVQHLINLGVTHLKSKSLSFPDIKTEYYPHFLRGLFDGDGCITQISNTKRYSVQVISTPELLNFIKLHIFSQLGIDSFSEIIVCHHDNFNVVKWIINKQDFCKKFLDYIYKDSCPETRLERKFQKYNDFHLISRQTSTDKSF